MEDLVRERTVTALKALVLGVAARQPLVLIIEDVHWTDKATEEVVGAVVESMVAVAGEVPRGGRGDDPPRSQKGGSRS